MQWRKKNESPKKAPQKMWGFEGHKKGTEWGTGLGRET